VDGIQGELTVSDLSRKVKKEIQWTWDNLKHLGESYGYKINLKLYKPGERSDSFEDGLASSNDKLDDVVVVDEVDDVAVVTNTPMFNYHDDDRHYQFSLFDDFIRINVKGNEDETLQELFINKMKMFLGPLGFNNFKDLLLSQKRRLLSKFMLSELEGAPCSCSRRSHQHYKSGARSSNGSRLYHRNRRRMSKCI
jgi:hypothetical protein